MFLLVFLSIFFAISEWFRIFSGTILPEIISKTSGFLMFLWGIVSVNLDNFVSIKMIHQKAIENLPFLYNPFMHNDEKWSNTVWILQCEHCLIFNVCLTILHHSACKGQGNSFFREIFFIFLYQYFSYRIAGDCYWNAFSRKYLDHIKRM